MTWQQRTASALLAGVMLVGCAADLAPGSLEASTAGSPAPVALGPGEVELDAGIHRFDLTALSGGEQFPPFEATIPAGWTSTDGWAINRPSADGETASVAVTFWNVDEVYGHPCQWDGTLLQPGPTVEDLVATLHEVPMRGQKRPLEVEIDGHTGMYLEWSVPSDIAFEDGSFPDCDADEEGNFDFRSWTGKGWASTRYHQAPGQVDRLWILDVDGARLVIDAFVMPDASGAAVEELAGIVRSIRFLDD